MQSYTTANNVLEYASASAPGKVILCGEYAVLQGHSALVISVDRRVKVHLERAPIEGVEVIALGLQAAPEKLNWSASGELVAGAASKLCMFASTVNALIHHTPSMTQFRRHGWRCRIDSSALFHGDNKLGLGSSAALTVALSEALSVIFAEDVRDAESRWPTLHTIHSYVQGKRGSGVDIAASLSGGATVFRNIEHHRCELKPFNMPAGLHIAFIWSGESASTPAYLKSLAQWKSSNEGLFDRHMETLGGYSSSVCKTGAASSFLNALQQFTQALNAFDIDAELGIFGAGHDVLYQMSQEYSDLLYKPCGAGGGDLGVVVSVDLEAQSRYLKTIAALGFNRVALSIDHQGVNRFV